MSIKINFSSKDLEKSINKELNKALKKGVNNKCPNCGHPMIQKLDKNTCKHCHADINLHY